MSRVSDAQLREVAQTMAPRFLTIVRSTGTLTPEQMREAIKQARREGVRVKAIVSDRSLQRINEHIVETH